MRDDWLDVTLYLVEFTVSNNKKLNRLLAFKEQVDDTVIGTILMERFPQIIAINHIDEWGTAVAPIYGTCSDESSLTTKIM